MLLDRFTQLVDSQPEAIFFSGDNYEVTFEELSYAMGGRTKSLAGVGITKGLRVAIILADSRDIIEILLSCWQLGAIPVLVSSQSTPMEKDQFLESSQPHIIITNWEISEELVDIDIPIFYYNIWDDLPDPKYNRDFYRSSDLLMSISKQTYGLNYRILEDHGYKDNWKLKYVPHGDSSKRFFKVPQLFLCFAFSWGVLMVSAAELDSISKRGETLAFNRELNLTDLFFQYGFRIDPVLVKDLYSANITSLSDNNQPNQVPWLYNPVVIPKIKHAIVNNINPVRFEFANSI